MKAQKCILMSAAAYSVVFGLIFVTLAVLAILARNCTIDMTGSGPLVYMMFLLYFRVNECKAMIDFNLLDIQTTGVQAQIPSEADTVFRTYIFAFVYVGLYGALIFTALFALFGINNSCLGRRSFPVFFAPWIFVCCAIFVMDVLATTYYIMDAVKATSVEGLMTLLEIQNPAAVVGAFETLAVYLRFLPTIIMFLTTSKLFVCLIFDIIMIALIIKSGWAVASYHRYVDDTIRQYSQNLSRNNPAFESSENDIATQKRDNKQLDFNNGQNDVQHIPLRPETAAQPETPNRYNDTSAQTFVYPYAMNQQQEKNSREQANSQRPTSLALQSKLNERPVQNAYNQKDDEREIENRLRHFTTSNGNVIRSVEPLKDENIPEPHYQMQPQRQEPQQMQNQPNRVRVLPMVAQINRNSSEHKQRPPVPPKPYNPNRVSQNPSFMSDRPESRNSANKVDRTSSMHAPEELRGQLPWSYFKARDDIPKKAFTDLKEDEELPRVPIPDYTLHFPKAKRANVSDSDGDGSWGRYDPGQSQRY